MCSKSLLNQGITGYLKQNTVLLVTHQLNYISYAADGEQFLFESGNEILRRLEDPMSLPDLLALIWATRIRSDLGSLPYRSNRSPSTMNKLFRTTEPTKEIQAMEKRMQAEDDKVNFVYQAYLSYFKYGRIALYGPLLVLVFGLTQLNAIHNSSRASRLPGRSALIWIHCMSTAIISCGRR